MCALIELLLIQRDAGSLNFAFGAGQANRPVQVQIIGGDESWGGTLQASVDGNIKGSFSGDFNNLGAADDFRGDALAVGNPPGDGGHADKAGGGREDEVHGGRAHSTFYLQTATIAGLSWGR